jgi:hypothetical protein
VVGTDSGWRLGFDRSGALVAARHGLQEGGKQPPRVFGVDVEAKVKGRLVRFVAGTRRPWAVWKRKTAELLAHLGQLAGGGHKVSVVRKAERAKGCGEFVTARSCACCGVVDGGEKPWQVVAGCDLRICPLCERVRAEGLRLALEAAVAATEGRTEDALARLRAKHAARPDDDGKPPGRKEQRQLEQAEELVRALGRGRGRNFSWRMITLTDRFDPRDPAQFEPRVLADRIKRLLASARECWSKSLKEPDAGAYFSLEISPGGAVHIHALHWGSYSSIPELQAIHLKHCPSASAGAVDVRQVKPGSRGMRSAVAEVAKYICKGAHVQAVVNGRPVDLPDPALAALVEFTFSTRLRGKHIHWGVGVLQKVGIIAEELAPNADRDGDAGDCPHCGGHGWDRHFERTCRVWRDEIRGITKSTFGSRNADQERIQALQARDEDASPPH